MRQEEGDVPFLVIADSPNSHYVNLNKYFKKSNFEDNGERQKASINWTEFDPWKKGTAFIEIYVSTFHTEKLLEWKPSSH